MPFSKRQGGGGGGSGGGQTAAQVSAAIGVAIANAPHAISIAGTNFNPATSILRIASVRDDDVTFHIDIDLSSLNGNGGLNQAQVEALVEAGVSESDHATSIDSTFNVGTNILTFNLRREGAPDQVDSIDLSALAGLNQGQVDALIAAAGHLTEAQVNSLIAAAGHLTTAEVNELIAGAGHLTSTQVDTLINAAVGGFVTAAQVTAMLDALDSTTQAELTQAIAQAGHASAGTVSAVNSARISGDSQLGARIDALDTRVDDVVSDGGGLAEVTSDDTLDGAGTGADPLGLADSSLLPAHFTLAAVPRDALPDNVINQPKLADDSVATAKIPDGNVTEPKLSEAVRQKLNVVGATPASVNAERDLRVAGDADLSARLTALQHVQSVVKVGNQFHVTTVIDGVATTAQLVDSTGGSSGVADGTILYGAGIPASSLGVDGDAYLDNGTGHFYKKGAGVWLQIADAVLIHELTEAVNSLTLLINAKADAAALVQEVQDRAAADTVLTERLDGRNEFTDGEKLKLGNVEAGATADQDLSLLATGVALANEAETRLAEDTALGVRIDNIPAPVASGGSGNGIVTFEDYHVSAAVSLSVSNRLVATGIVIPEAERTGYWLINFGTVGGYVSGAEFIMDASKLFALPGQVSGTERNLSESLCFTDAIGQGFDACLGHTGIGQILYF